MANKRGAPLTSFLWAVNLKPATQPCKYPAGSLERLETYRMRFERGEVIFHPRDNWEVQCVSLAGRPKEPGIQEINLSQLLA